mmetsp:Transcript_5769/g.13584  ORF Transcript_5769/g.13584 Transcript_5769/m.13584 type:complete len:107 (+) Transcript_5769:62-382(+)
MPQWYHYTSRSAAESIKRDGRIRGSTPLKGDAVYGSGVYMTDLPPSSSDSRLADLWGGGSRENAAVAIEMDDGHCGSSCLRRCRDNVYLYPGDVCLNTMTHRFIFR